jgi:hypothetical protein
MHQRTLFTVGQSNLCLVPEEQRDMDGQEEIDCSPSVVIKVTKTQ